jgi:N-acetylneuraminate synthase|tara:strand:+ start:132 stop:962 length:831 start_codon:yes stop_codon:yes gene_type:complete
MQNVYVIAEIGINHNGSENHARKLIDQAHRSGCHAVKFQKRNPDLCVPEDQKNKIRETPWGEMTYLEYKWKIEFSVEQYQNLRDYTKMLGMDFIVSCWDEQSVDDIELNVEVDYHKVASALATDISFLKKLAATGKPTILSTGMCTPEQVDAAVVALGDSLKYILACTSTYPSIIEELNLNYIKTLQKKYPNIKAGFSNHYSGFDASLAAAALGSQCIEFHITDSRTQFGTDQAASIENSKELVRQINIVSRMLGDGVKKVYDSEIPIMKKLRNNG